jgi:glycosyltransferase involved in cell wall biosynthesis
MNSSPLVSIIIPCYNQAQFLTETLESVYHQTHTNWECLIINDGSPDNTEEIALEWCVRDKRFKYFKKENGGLSSARNFGIQKSNGQWIQFLDSDDLLEENKLMCQVEFLNINKSDIFISGYRYFNNQEGSGKLRIMGRNDFTPEVVIQNDDNVDIIKLFSIKNPFVISAPLYRREVFSLVGNFDENFKSLEDWDFNFRCAKANLKFHHIGYHPMSKTLIRLHPSSMMTNNKNMESAYMQFIYKHMLLEREIESVETLRFKIKQLIKEITPPILIKTLRRIIR